ncbi:UDP-2,3-diacylglucosamine diphosphatase [Sulfurimonas paralvinellae]|uniref:UDP-2,3-diacylglucosamine diphosphatase n=1 Tax=Sulfurimonas paralvinellae TaxID=317658 RepID=A0A7M1B6B3_9BACT|nr:UDP-2,3-diacylglucosamine diphosphatase [Sulfurimonas paralvinellae]QOP45200.1 UDP-2,3-diacylglucosamine diphosphatase [Sulfurimonas paralvinellae]
MSHSIEIKEGAYIISDAHYSDDRVQLLAFIKAIHSKELKPTQLILMGDIFDALFGLIDYTYETNQEMIDLLEVIAEDIEVFYFEGNHDFNLKAIFKNIQIFPIAKQPLLASYKNKKIYLAHGDFDAPFGYQLYTALIRNPFMLFVLKYIDIALNHFIINKIEGHLDKKDDCKELVWFEDFIQKRFRNKYKCDYFIEGHFHQNKTLRLNSFTYINLGAFACNQRYFIVKSVQDKELLEEHQFSNER